MAGWTTEDTYIMISRYGRAWPIIEAERKEYPLVALRSLSGSRQVMRNEYAYHERNGTLDSAEAVY